MRKKAFLVIIVVCWWLFSALYAEAFFGDSEGSANNRIAAGILDIAIEGEVGTSAVEIATDEHVVSTFSVRNQGSFEAVYTVKSLVRDGVTTCQLLSVDVRNNGDLVYSGLLSGVDVSAQNINASNLDTWQLDIRANAPGNGEECAVAFVIDARQPGTSLGFFDQEVSVDRRISIEKAVVQVAVPVGKGWDMDSESRACTLGTTAWSNGLRGSFEWLASSNAASYEYEVTDPSGTSTVHPSATTATSEIDFAQEGLWSFRVRGRADTVTSEWSATCTLYIDRVVPVPTSPVQVDFVTPPQTQNASNGVTFEWSTSEDAQAFVYFDKNPSSFFDYTTYAYRAPANTNDAPFTMQQSVLVAFPGPGTYFYKVVMIDRAGNLTVSPPGVFNVPSIPAIDVISLNEIIANPEGNDNAPMPGGEWVELYNSGTLSVDLAGWRIKDAAGKSWIISSVNSDANGNTSDAGETVIEPGGYLVVYRNGASMAINNTGGEEIFLYDAYGNLMDSHSFSVDGMPVGKSVARFPDGVGVWIDPAVTPGGKNALSTEERDMLRAHVFKTCFKETETLIVNDKGSLCDPVFVAYIGMIKDDRHRGLVLEGFVKDDEVRRDNNPVEEDIFDGESSHGNVVASDDVVDKSVDNIVQDSTSIHEEGDIIGGDEVPSGTPNVKEDVLPDEKAKEHDEEESIFGDSEEDNSDDEQEPGADVDSVNISNGDNNNIGTDEEVSSGPLGGGIIDEYVLPNIEGDEGHGSIEVNIAENDSDGTNETLHTDDVVLYRDDKDDSVSTGDEQGSFEGGIPSGDEGNSDIEDLNEDINEEVGAVSEVVRDNQDDDAESSQEESSSEEVVTSEESFEEVESATEAVDNVSSDNKENEKEDVDISNSDTVIAQ